MLQLYATNTKISFFLKGFFFGEIHFFYEWVRIREVTHKKDFLSGRTTKWEEGCKPPPPYTLTTKQKKRDLKKYPNPKLYKNTKKNIYLKDFFPAQHFLDTAPKKAFYII